MSQKASIAIIGAGMAGLTAARALSQVADVQVFEKSRGVGGRLATRYAERFEFDHGAPFFTAKHPDFKAFIDAMMQQGVIERWEGRFVEMEGSRITSQRAWGDDPAHYVAAPKMNALGKFLAQGLSIHQPVRIASLKQSGGRWLLIRDAGSEYGAFDWVISAAPAEQASALLPSAFCGQQRLRETEMLGCYALMLGFASPLALPFDAALIKQADISWISVNSSKPGRDAGCMSLAVLATNAWAQAHMEDDPEEVMAHVIAEASRVTGIDLTSADHRDLHCWRYANISRQSGEPFILDAEHRLMACGDWCIQGRVEAAYLSGKAAAERLKQELQQ